MTTEFNPDNWQDEFGDAILKHAPTDKWSKNPVERRIQMMYGEVYKQEQLNEATRHAIPEMFGVANLTTFNQIAMLVRKGKILNNKGKDVYLPHLERLALPVTFIHGAENNLFLPEGTLKTLKTLAAHNDAKHYAHIMFPNYAHMDLFIGKDAAKDIYPTIVAELERWN
jgi:cholesterol oxidase